MGGTSNEASVTSAGDPNAIAQLRHSVCKVSVVILAIDIKLLFIYLL